MNTNTRGVSEAMVDEGCAAFSRLQGRQTSTCIHGGTHTMTELRKAVRATIEAALSAPEPAAQGEAVNVPGYDVGWKIRGVTAYDEAKRKGYRHPECVEAAIKAAPPAQTAERVPEAVVVPYGSESGEKDYAYGYEKGRADGWNACRDAMLAASPAPAQPAERVPDGEVRLWDTQWLNIVNHDNCYRDWDKADAINHAVKMTEQAIARNVADGKLPSARITASPAPSEGGKGVDHG